MYFHKSRKNRNLGYWGKKLEKEHQLLWIYSMWECQKNYKMKISRMIKGVNQFGTAHVLQVSNTTARKWVFMKVRLF